MTPEPNRARASEAPSSDPGSHIPPAQFLFRRLVLSGYMEADGGFGADDYPVKVNAMI